MSKTIEIRAFGDPWMDNALENFLRILEDVDSCSVEITPEGLRLKIEEYSKFVKEFSKKLLEKRQNLMVIEKDKKTGEIKEVKKDHILIQEEKKIGGKVAFKEEIFKPEKTLELLDRIFGFREGKNRCILCGKSYDKSVKKLQQANYPFVTKIASLSGVRSYKDGTVLSLKEYYDSLCPICYLLGILEWTDEATIYRTFPGEYSLLFIPLARNLEELHRFKKGCIYYGVLRSTGRYSNIRADAPSEGVEFTPGKYSTLLCFYERFVELAVDELPAKEWVVLHIPFGSVKNVRVDRIAIGSGILSIIREIYGNGEHINKIYGEIIRKIYFRSEKGGVDNETTNEVREVLAEAVLTDNLRKFTGALLPKKGGFVVFNTETRMGLEELIFVWRWKRMGVSKEKLESIRSVGNVVAKVSKSNASLLYKLDKVRTLDEFWSVLREVARKLPGLEERDLRMLKPKSLDEVIQLVKEIVESDRDGWKEVRDLIVIYASMFYSIDRMSKSQKGGGEE
ncbi:hypothetical protein [Geoglobus sp.]